MASAACSIGSIGTKTPSLRCSENIGMATESPTGNIRSVVSTGRSMWAERIPPATPP